jgi:hypothetical protein
MEPHDSLYCPLDPVLRKFSSVHARTLHFFNINFNIILNLRHTSQEVSLFLIFRLQFYISYVLHAAPISSCLIPTFDQAPCSLIEVIG